MRALLGFAAIAAIASTASAQSFTASSFTAPSVGLTANWAHTVPPSDSGRRDGNGGVRIHRGERGRNLAFGGYAGGYYDYGDFDGNRQFDADKWNDWWHERPERAFPRWMSRNQDCARLWFSGNVLTC